MLISIPSKNDLNEINRVLINIYLLSKDCKSASIKSVIDQSSTLSLGGRVINYLDIIKLCNHLNLVQIKSNRVELSTIGMGFIDCNPDKYYEVNESQKIYFAEKIMFLGQLKSKTRDFFLNFSPNYLKFTFELNTIDSLIDEKYEALTHLLKILCVVKEENNFLYVTPNYVSLVSNLRAEESGKTDDELKELLLANEKLANQAEDEVLKFEQNRLLVLGKELESSLVRKISKLNVGAGYDIQSFDGDQPSLEYNRFIEVKASVNKEIRFYWSANERKVAEKLGDKYWIYFVGEFKRNASDIHPYMIQNPLRKIHEIPEFTEEADRYVISLLNVIDYKVLDTNKIKGYLI